MLLIKRLPLSITLVTALLLTAACSQQPSNSPAEPPTALKRINVSSVKSVKGEFDKNKAFHWQSSLHAIGDKAADYQTLMPALSEKINSQLQQRGYKVSQQLQDAEYILVAAVLVEGHQQSLEHKILLEGLDPGLQVRDNYGLGTLLIGIKEANNDQFLWRGAAQLMLTDKTLSPEFKQQRIDHALSLLFNGVL